MAKGKEGGIEVIAKMPWQAGIALGVLGYVGLRYGLGWYASSVNNPVWQAMGKQLSAGAYAPFAWLVLGLCWMGAFASYIGQRQRSRLLDTRTGLESLRAISWREFEMLVGEAFRRQGYAIQETGLGGADGGIDLILGKDSATTLVQCKQWRSQRVDVKVVREMFGLLAHHGAAAVKIVAVGDYTADARRFAEGKPIELISGTALLELVRSIQTTAPEHAPHVPATTLTDAAPPRPKCGQEMQQRANKRTKERFWGCPAYPSCRGTRQLAESAL